MKADLHVHTNASDGKHSPGAVVKMAADRGLSVLAITDHDTVAGLAEALTEAAKYPGLVVVPGVEVSTDVPAGEVHVLGYFVDHQDAAFMARLEVFRRSRSDRGRKMVDRLADLGIVISWDRVKELAGAASIGRPHVAQAMMEKGYISSLREAFERYIGREGPAYVERYKMTPAEAVELIVNARGVASLAHPGTIPEVEDTIRALKQVGLSGVEAYYGGYPPELVGGLAGLALKYGLVATGGSDYHGLDTGETGLGEVNIPRDSVEALLKLGDRTAKRASKAIDKA